MPIEITIEQINLIALMITLFMVIITGITFYYQRKSQRDNLLNELAMKRIKVWNKQISESNQFYLERVINFYEYLAYLVLNNKINQKSAKDLFKDDIRIIFEKYSVTIKKNSCWKEIFKLKKKWVI